MRRWAVLAALAVLALLAGAPLAHAAVGPASPRLVVVGVPGLAWSDLDGGDLPTLDAMAGEGALGSMTVRAVGSSSCAVDGWLTLSAGRRAGDVAGPCRVAPPVVDGRVPRWGEYLAAAAAGSYDARPGTLGQQVTASGACVETVGAAGAIGGADRAGEVTNHHTELPAQLTCPVVLVDGGVLPAPGPAREAALQRVDALVARVRAADPGADVVVAGVADGASPVRPRAAVAAGPSFPRGLLESASTRQPGVVQLQDLTATALARVGASVAEVTGRPLTVAPSSASAAALVAGRVGAETRAATLRALSPQVTGWLAAAYAAWAVAVAVLWSRRGGGADAVPAWVRAAGVVVATVPVSTFVVNLVPWWRGSSPAVLFVGALAVVVALVTAVALRVGANRPVGALRVVAVLTLVVLSGDVLTGSGLQLGSVFGQNPVVGGRFYGLGNTSFALYGLAVLVVVEWVAASGRSRRVAAGLALVVLVAALAVEALPSFGADFGGPPGLLLGGLLVVATAAEVRLTWRRVLAAVVAAGALVALVAVADWLRPAGSRTHLGDFVESVVSGEAGAVVGRKLSQNLANLGSPPLLVIAVATVVLVLVARRVRWRPVPDGAVVLGGAAVMALVGFLANDSGLVIPAFVALVLAPLLVAAGPWHQELQVSRGTEVLRR
ncbi:MAG: hypothetical protein ACJ715_09150 [Ornithinibacter sp.]